MRDNLAARIDQPGGRTKPQRRWLTWLWRIAVLLLLLLAAGFAAVYRSSLRTERPVGFQTVVAKLADGRQLPIGVWYPTRAQPSFALIPPLAMHVARDAPVDGRGLPLVVISHGNGAGLLSHVDLAMALASAGHVVAAPMHTGDNFQQQGAMAKASYFAHRNGELRGTIDHLLKDWSGHASIDPGKVGAYGFSMGGFTAMTAIGARPDLQRIATHCAAKKDEFVCGVLRHFKSPWLAPQAGNGGGALVADARIRAAVLAAPGMDFTLRPEDVAGVIVPVQLWIAEKDALVRVGSVLQSKGGAPVEIHTEPGATHMSFLTPCGALGVLAPAGVCSDPGFDRESFHQRMNKDVVAFFQRTLK